MECNKSEDETPWTFAEGDIYDMELPSFSAAGAQEQNCVPSWSTETETRKHVLPERASVLALAGNAAKAFLAACFQFELIRAQGTRRN